jgi:ankyrin repeat protein
MWVLCIFFRRFYMKRLLQIFCASLALCDISLNKSSMFCMEASDDEKGQYFNPLRSVSPPPSYSTSVDAEMVGYMKVLLRDEISKGAAASLANIKYLLENFESCGIDINSLLGDPNKRAIEGDIVARTPLTHAIHSGCSLVAISYMIEHGAYIDTPDACAETPLIVAAQLNQDDTIKRLMQCDDERCLECVSDEWPECPFDVIDHIILPLMPIPGLDHADNYGRTAFLCAANNNNFGMVKHFLSFGADINRQDNAGTTALSCAASYNNLEMVCYLLDNGADANLQNSEHNAPLIWAADFGNLEMVKYLLEKMADIDYQHNNGETALMSAATHNNQAMVEFLFSKGANKMLTNVAGQRAADLTENPALIMLLS